MKVVVFTAIYDGYDDVHEPEWTGGGTEYRLFTDDSNLTSDRWKVVHVPGYHHDPTRNARKIKILSHQFVPDADWTVWIDGNMTACGDFAELIPRVTGAGEYVIMAPRHPEYTFLTEDARTLLNDGRANPELVYKQIGRYLVEGVGLGPGIAETNVLLRDNTGQVKNFNDLWWQEYEGGCRRDQMSFHYAIWKTDPRWGFLPESHRYYWRSGEMVKSHPHKKKTRHGW